MANDEGRFRSVARAAWADFGDPRAVAGIEELSPMVSTNRVYRLHLDDGSSAVAKVSSYGSFFLFAEDHERLHRFTEQLIGGHYEGFLARAYTAGGRPYLWYDGQMWAILYHEVRMGDPLPRQLNPRQVERFATEIARFHLASAEASTAVRPTSKSVVSDAIHLSDLLDDRAATTRFGLDRSRLDVVRRHTHRFLMRTYEVQYGEWPKMPVLVDWNLGNFSVRRTDDSDDFELYSRWDYDWFRVESRLFDFYFLSRVSSRTGDRTRFTYSSHTLVEPRFVSFVAAYHQLYPLTELEVGFLEEAYRFFLLNYVVREGQHFFRHDVWRQLQHDVVDVHLPLLDELDLSPLLRVVA